MMYGVYGIFDSKALAYMQPFFSASKGEAIRLITELSNDPKHNFNKYALDFTLFCFGSFDNVKGQFITLLTPEAVVKCIELIKVKE